MIIKIDDLLEKSGVAQLQKVVRLIKHVNHELDYNVALVVRPKPDLPDLLLRLWKRISKSLV